MSRSENAKLLTAQTHFDRIRSGSQLSEANHELYIGAQNSPAAYDCPSCGLGWMLGIARQLHYTKWCIVRSDGVIIAQSKGWQ